MHFLRLLAYSGYVEPGWLAGRGLNARQVHLVDQHFVPAEFLLDFQDVFCNMLARGQDPRPTRAPRYEVKERFTGLITDGSDQQVLLVKHLKPVLRQLIANQMFGLLTYQQLAAGIFIESTLCAEVASVFSTLFEARWARGLLDGFPVLQALQDLVDAYRNSRSALTMRREMDNIKLLPHSSSSVALARKFFQDLFVRERLTEQETRHELDSANQYRATRADEYSKVVRASAPALVLDIHSKAPPGSLNNYETNWEVYNH